MNTEPLPPEDGELKLPGHNSAAGFALARIARFVVKRLPPDWGFVVLAFPLDGSEGLRYCSNGDRAAVLRLLKEFVVKQTLLANGALKTQNEVPPPRGP